ncbi:MAG: hypothetical protein IH947_01890 [Bacteroidetes bacterium]|nr:hypothetical protein [Bacteroidota bacterium]
MKFTELIDLFKEGKATSKSHMKNLLEMAMIDSHFDDYEYQLLKKLAKKHKVSDKELKKIQENPAEVKFELPVDAIEKFEQFYELINMMTIDEKIYEEEVNLCIIFAKKFGYKNQQELVDAITQNIKNGLPWEETRKRVGLLLQ